MPNQQSPTDSNELEVVNYVPDEVCVVVSADGISDGQAFYEHVRTRLNTRLVELLGQSRPPARGKQATATALSVPPLQIDLTPLRLAARFAADASPLQPLVRAGINPRAKPRPSHDDSGPRELPPFLSLRREQVGATTWHFYFQLGRDRVDLDSKNLAERRDRLECIRELVLLLNTRTLAVPQERFRRQTWSVQVVSPNWLTAAAPFSCGSPAGLPIAVTRQAKRHPFDFPDADLKKALDGSGRGKVIVAVLDTCPTQDTVNSAASAFSGNELLVDVKQHVPMNSPALVPDTYYASHLQGALPRLQWDMTSGPVASTPDQFKMADHGLFAAGIIYSIVPQGTPVYLIRALNDFGIGDTLAIAHALSALPSTLLGTDQPGPRQPRLIVNLSLGAEIPIPARLFDRWLPETSKNGGASYHPEMCALFDKLHGNLSDVLSWLAERGVLVVAAAGNDALRRDVTPGEPPPPRYPARYEDVLGVAAVRRDLHLPAVYSNRGDVVLQAGSGHVATFGGNVDPAPNDQSPPTTSATDSVIGIFSGQLPGGGANKTGWARWSGTSFSTPIVAGIAARLWAADRSRSPLGLALHVRSLGQDMHPGVDPYTPLEVPVLYVSQS